MQEQTVKTIVVVLLFYLFVFIFCAFIGAFFFVAFGYQIIVSVRRSSCSPERIEGVRKLKLFIKLGFADDFKFA